VLDTNFIIFQVIWDRWGCSAGAVRENPRILNYLRWVQESVSSIQTVMATALVLGCATASVTLWYFSRRYVGELALLRGKPGCPSKLCFSVLDFWGNREVSNITSDVSVKAIFQAGGQAWPPQPPVLQRAGLLRRP
jgi:hypothetical protein